MNKKDIIEIIAEQKNLTKKETGEIIDLALETIKKAVASGETVDLTGFGRFEISHRGPRVGINPSTKEKIEIAASKSPKFKPAKTFKDMLK